MAKKKRRRSRKGAPSAEPLRRGRGSGEIEESARPPRPATLTLSLALALAAAHALWALFQWRQLVLARTGADYFCGLAGADDCAAVWDSPLAKAVQSGTGLPVAGWGLAWSMVAFALPLWVLVRRARRQPHESAWAGTLLTALAGIVGVVVLAGASLSSGQLCTTCAVTYALVLAYAASCLREADKLRSPQLRRGAVLGLGAISVAFLALLYPGLRTPRGSAEQKSALIEVLERSDTARLEQLIERLSPQFRQGLSDALAAYAEDDRVPLRPARLLVGPPTAPVRITEFSDILCSHCADLHETMTMLGEMLPRGSFALEPRQFPLDSECNPEIEKSSGEGVRCLAARALICVEEEPMAFAGALFANQRWLTKEKIYELAEPFMPRERLQDCVASPETEAKLQDDIEWAVQHDIQGTPLVLVNGHKAPASLHVLFALVLAEADPKHPAFAALPAPRPRLGRR